MSSQGGAPFPKDPPLSTHLLSKAFFPQEVGIATCMLPLVSISASCLVHANFLFFLMPSWVCHICSQIKTPNANNTLVEVSFSLLP